MFRNQMASWPFPSPLNLVKLIQTDNFWSPRKERESALEVLWSQHTEREGKEATCENQRGHLRRGWDRKVVRKPKEKNERQRRHTGKTLGNQLGPGSTGMPKVIKERFQVREALGNQVIESWPSRQRHRVELQSKRQVAGLGRVTEGWT